MKKSGLVEFYATPEEFASKLSRQLSIQLNTHSAFAQAAAPVPQAATEPAVELSDIAAEILRETALAQDGTLFFLHHLGGYKVQVNGKDLTRPGPRGEAELTAAIEDLENLSLLSPTSYKRELFRLTASGYKVAESLQDQL